MPISSSAPPDHLTRSVARRGGPWQIAAVMQRPSRLPCQPYKLGLSAVGQVFQSCFLFVIDRPSIVSSRDPSHITQQPQNGGSHGNRLYTANLSTHSGTAGVLFGSVAGILRSAHPVLFAAGAGMQWFGLGAVFWGKHLVRSLDFA